MSDLRIYETPTGDLVEQNGGSPRLLKPVFQLRWRLPHARPVATLSGDRTLYLLPDGNLVLHTRTGPHLMEVAGRAEVTPDMVEVAILEQDAWDIFSDVFPSAW